MEEDIQNYSPTVMFRGTPCVYKFEKCELVYFRTIVSKLSSSVFNSVYYKMTILFNLEVLKLFQIWKSGILNVQPGTDHAVTINMD